MRSRQYEQARIARLGKASASQFAFERFDAETSTEIKGEDRQTEPEQRKCL